MYVALHIGAQAEMGDENRYLHIATDIVQIGLPPDWPTLGYYLGIL